jgi:hypothetical protein
MVILPAGYSAVRSPVPLRFTYLAKKGSRSRGILRTAVNLIDSAAHDLVAFACRFFEPRSVNLDQTPPIRSDSTRHPELAHNIGHSRSSYSKQLRKRLLRQR